jgi:hypothetical protein
MNQLNVSLQHSILTLAGHGWSARRIARELDLNRETVGKYLRLARSKPAISTPGAPADSFSKPAISTLGCADVPAAEPAISTAGFSPGRQSLCQPFAQQIEAAAGVGLSAQRIYQDLVTEHGFTGSYQAVKRFVRQWRRAQPAPFVRLEVEAGAEAQVDFGQGAWVLVDGKRKRPHLFRLVLSHSRKGYSEVVWRQTTESFIRCLENAFRYLGGVPRTLVIDYVPRNTIDLLCPDGLCARPSRTARKSGNFGCAGSHNFYRVLSHFSSSASSRQMGFR